MTPDFIIQRRQGFAYGLLNLNKVWEVQPQETSSIWLMIRERVLSFGMVLSIGFLLMVSLLVSTALAAMSSFFSGVLPIPAPVIAAINFLISFGGIAVLFGLIFKFVPAIKTPWRLLWPGSMVTALLFTIGKSLIGLYLGKASVGSTYGAAGSIIVLIVWVYYSAQIFLFGAEFTRSYSRHRFSGFDDSGNSNQTHAAA